MPNADEEYEKRVRKEYRRIMRKRKAITDPDLIDYYDYYLNAVRKTRTEEPKSKH